MRKDCIAELEVEELEKAFRVLDMMSFSFRSILRCKNLDLPAVHKVKF